MVARFICRCPYYGAKSGQARGPAPTDHPAVGATPCGCPFCSVWPVCLWLPVLYCQIRAGTGACPYGPPRRWGNHRGLPVLFVVLRNQGRHGGLPLRSTPRRGNPRWLPVLFVVARWFAVARIMVPNQGRHGGLPLRSTPPLGQPPVVARFVCRCPSCGSKSGQARGPAPTVHPAVGATPCGCPFCSSIYGIRAGRMAGPRVCVG